MKYIEIITESIEFYDLIKKFNHSITIVSNDLLENYIKDFKKAGISERRKELGYHEYKDTSLGYKPFNNEEFEQLNQSWNVNDWISQNLSQLIPKEGRSPIYNFMGKISDILTKDLQEYLKNKFGNELNLGKSLKRKRNVSEITVSVWWKRSKPNSNYFGIYNMDKYDARYSNNITNIEVIIDKDIWTENIQNNVMSFIFGEQVNWNFISKNIIPTLVHEIQHLMQDIKGNHFRKNLLVSKKKEKESNDLNRNFQIYISRLSEIDAHATGAASELINDLILDNLKEEDWNNEIKLILKYPLDYIPQSEFFKYLDGYDEKEFNPFLIKKVKQRFLKTFIKRIQSYLR